MTKLVGGDSCMRLSPRHAQCSVIARCRLTSAANSPPTFWVHLLNQDVLEFRPRQFVWTSTSRHWRRSRTAEDCLQCHSISCLPLFSRCDILLTSVVWGASLRPGRAP